MGSSADAVVNPSSAAQAAQVVVDALANGNPHAIFVHLDDPDYAGHAFGFSPFVFPYLDSIEEMDALVGLMLDALESREAYTEENWLVLVTTDHGGIGTSHGGNSIEERRVFVIASGESVSPEWVSRDTLSVVGAAENCLGTAPLLSFDGSSRASVPVHADFLPGANGDFTVECRVRTAQGADVSMVGNKDWNSGLNPGWVFSFTYPSGPGWRVNAGDGASRIDLDGPPIADGTWHTLSCSFDRDGMMRMYTDGVLSDEADMSGLADLDVEGLFFGADALGAYGMEGVVSEVRYWSEALDGGVIADWHCSPLTMAHPDWAALLGHWPLDEGVGDFLEDVSGNGHHGTNEGGLWDSDGVSVQWGLQCDTEAGRRASHGFGSFVRSVGGRLEPRWKTPPGHLLPPVARPLSRGPERGWYGHGRGPAVGVGVLWPGLHRMNCRAVCILQRTHLAMRHSLLSLLLLFFMTPLWAQTWTLSWSDEFNGSSIDNSKWGYDIGTGAAQGLWGWGQRRASVLHG